MSIEKELFHKGYMDALASKRDSTYDNTANRYNEGWNIGLSHRQSGKRLKGYEKVLFRMANVRAMMPGWAL